MLPTRIYFSFFLYSKCKSLILYYFFLISSCCDALYTYRCTYKKHLFYLHSTPTLCRVPYITYIHLYVFQMYIFFLGAQTKWAKKGFHSFPSHFFCISVSPLPWTECVDKFNRKIFLLSKNGENGNSSGCNAKNG